MSGDCKTPVTETSIEDVFAGATVIVKAVWLPVPENVSVRKAAVKGWFPINAIVIPLLGDQYDQLILLLATG